MKSVKVSKFGKQVLSLLLVVMMLTAQFAGVLPAYATEGEGDGSAVVENGDGGTSGGEQEREEKQEEKQEEEQEQEQEQEWTVKFELGYEGAPIAQTRAVKNDEKVAAPETPIRSDGYTFDYWYLLTAAGEQDTDKDTEYEFGDNGLSTQAVTGDITLKAKWLKNYTVKFVDADESVEFTVADGKTVTAPAALTTKEEKVFKGWKNGESEVIPADTEIIVTGDVTYSAVWNDTVKVTLDHGYTVDDKEVTETVWVEKGTSYNPDARTRTGYDFDIWKLNEDECTEVTVNEPITLTATWKRHEYTVTFIDPVDDRKFEEEALFEDTIERVDTANHKMEIVGWYKDVNELTNETKFVFGETKVTEDATYYAVWKGTIEFYDGENKIEFSDYSATYQYGVKKNLPATVTKDGYSFAGWYTTSTFDKNTEATTTNPTKAGVQEFYAKWEIKPEIDRHYTITPVKDGKSGTDLANDGWTNADSVKIIPTGVAEMISVDGGETWQEEYVVSDEGDYEVTFELKDEDDLESAEETASFHIDREAPTVKVSYADFNGILDSTEKVTAAIRKVNGIWRSTNGFKLTLTVDETNLPENWNGADAKVELYEDDAETAKKTYTTTWSDQSVTIEILPADLTEKMQYKLKISGITDKAGNVMEPVGSESFVYDEVNPSVTLNEVTGARYEDGEKYYYDAAAKAQFKVINSYLDDDLIKDPEYVVLTVSINGESHTYTAEELEKGIKSEATDTWTITIPLPLVKDKATTYETTLSVHDPVRTEVNEKTTANTKERIIDAAAPVFDSDSTKPTDVKAAAISRDITAKFTDDGSGVQTVCYYIEAADGYKTDGLVVKAGATEPGLGTKVDPVSISNGTTLSISTNDTEFRGTVYFYAVDNVGNKSAETEYEINIDNLAPEVKIEKLADDGVLYSSEDGIFKITVTDNNLTDTEASPITKKVSVTLQTRSSDDDEWTGVLDTAKDITYTEKKWSLRDDGKTWTNVITIKADKEKHITDAQYRIIVKAEDDVGNTTTEENSRANKTSDTLVIDTKLPELTIANPDIEPDHAGDVENETTFYTNTEKDVTFDLTINEHNLGTAENITVTVTKDGKDVDAEDYTYDPKSWTRSDKNKDEWTNTLTVNAGVDEGEYVVLLTAKDQANNNGDYKEIASKTLVIDRTDPDIKFAFKGSVFEGNRYANTGKKVQENTAYCIFEKSGTTELSVTVTIADTNIDLGGTSAASEGVIKIYRFDTLEDTVNPTFTAEKLEKFGKEGWESNEAGTAWENTVTIGETDLAGYYVAVVSATDKSTNVKEKKADEVLVNDLEAPTVEETEHSGELSKGAYNRKKVVYGIDLNATFVVSDNNKIVDDNIEKVQILKCTVDGAETALKSKSSIVEDGVVRVDFPSGEDNDGVYVVKIDVTDAAGNVTTFVSDYYVVDSTPPTAKIVSTGTEGDSGFDGNATWESEKTVSNEDKEEVEKGIGGVIGYLWNAIKEAFSFAGRYSKTEVNTTLYWKDNSDNFLNGYNAVTDVAYGVYYSEGNDQNSRYTKDKIESLKAAEDFWKTVASDTSDTYDEDTGFYSFEIPAIKASEKDSKFIVYLRVTDKVGNVIYLSSDGMIVEDELPVSETDGSAPSIAVSSENATGGYSDVHNRSVGLTINVLEKPDKKFSGIKSVTYGVEDSNGIQVGLNEGNATDTTDDDKLIEERRQGVTLSVAEGTESNGIKLTVTAEDNSGNQNKQTRTFNIDNHTPTAEVSYDNDTAYNNKYFNQPRTATIVVTELNFDTSNTTVTTQGSVSGWTLQPNGNTGTNTATVSYASDGDYTLAFQTTDKAGHTLDDSGVVYNGVATQDFTIDMTKPTVEITFRDAEGNTIPSGGYAKSAVTATITVTEHNFDESSATRGLTVTRDGVNHPVSLSWSNNGDTHTATLTFDEVEGAEYAFNMSFVDLANNQCDPFTEVGFFVDTKAPTIEVSGIKIDSANKDIADGQISITVTDKYYDANQVTLALKGAANGTVKEFYTSQPAVLLADGETWSATYVFNHLEKDDIYTLTVKATDKSGNVSTKMKVLESSQETEALKFSLNREGSTYDVDETTRALLDGYYTNKLKEDVIITIVNVDKLDLDNGGLSIVVVRDLIESLTLVEGEGYVIDSVEEIPGGYRYTVRIFKGVFAEDGAYSVLVSTKDMAGNSSRNDTAFDENHEMELQFYLDTKAPIIKLDNLDDGRTYPRNDQDDSAFRDGKYQAALLTVNDQTLDKVIVTLQYKDGPQSFTWTGDDLVMEGSTFTQELSDKYAIAEGLNIAIQVEALDKAGNVMYLSYSENADGTIEPTDDYTFTVSTNALIRFYANKGLFFGTIGGILVLAACVTGLVLSRRKKKETARA